MIREIFEETGIVIYNYLNLLEIKPILIYESCYHQKTTSQVLVIFFKIKINISKNEIPLKIQLEEVEAYAWVNIAIFKKLLYKPRPDDYYEDFEFIGNEYCYIENQFIEKVFNKKNFNNLESGEYIPYGHYLAIKYF